MKKNALKVCLISICIGMTMNLNAQVNVASHGLTLGLPEVSLLATQSAGVNLTLSSATTAGEAVLSEIADSSAYVQFSSVISDGSPRNLSVKYTGSMPGGTSLKAKAQDPNANSAGDFGTLVSTDVTLSTTDNTLISDIGSCYSGTSADDGYRIKYSWGLNDPESNYADIRATASASITVVLTLTAAL